MPNIELFGTSHLTGRGLRRLADDLGDRYATGADLGPRADHIRAIGHALTGLDADLQRKMREIAQIELGRLDEAGPALATALQRLSDQCRSLAQLAIRYQGTRAQA